jgi:hypothetical protein
MGSCAVSGCSKALATWNRSGLCAKHNHHSAFCVCGKRISYERDNCNDCYKARRAANRTRRPCRCGRVTKHNDGVCQPCRTLVGEQPAPKESNGPAVWESVIDDMRARDAEGRHKYGVPLRPFNGRDVLVDAYQEALDLCVYLRQAIYERDGR